MKDNVEKRFFFLSGLPRSGSTLLGAILNQNPRVFVTPTSPLMDILYITEKGWAQIPQSKTWHDPRLLSNVYHGIVHSIFRHIEAPIIIDKHRAWPRNINGIRQVFLESPKIICTVRDISEILASFLILVRKARQEGKSNFCDERLKSRNLSLTDENFCRSMAEHLFNDTYLSVKIGYDQAPACIHFVEYRDLLTEPALCLQRIYRFLNLPDFSHRFDRIENPIEEHDEFWGLDGLHRIRGVLKKTSPPASEVLGPSLHALFHEKGFEFWRKAMQSKYDAPLTLHQSCSL